MTSARAVAAALVCVAYMVGCGGASRHSATPAQNCAREAPTIRAGLNLVDEPGISLLERKAPWVLQQAARASSRLAHELRTQLPSRDAVLPAASADIAAALDRFAGRLPVVRGHADLHQLTALSQQLTADYSALLATLTRDLAQIRRSSLAPGLRACLVGAY